MGIPLRLALLTSGVGGIMGLIVLGAAAAAGCRRKPPYFLAGVGWGLLAVGLLLTDCLPSGRPSPISNAAFPIYYGGLFLFPAAMAWGRERWYLRYLYAFLVMLGTALPGIVVAVTAALCAFT